MYYTLYGKCICYSSFTLHFIKSMLKLKTKKYTAETNNYTLLSEESKKNGSRKYAFGCEEEER